MSEEAKYLIVKNNSIWKSFSAKNSDEAAEKTKKWIENEAFGIREWKVFVEIYEDIEQEHSSNG